MLLSSFNLATSTSKSIFSLIRGSPADKAFSSAKERAVSSISSQLLSTAFPFITWLMKRCFCSRSCQEYASNVFSVTYRYINTVLFSFPRRIILPSLCSISEGRQGTSKWCNAVSLSCTFVPAPIFRVEPIKIRISPLRTFANSSLFLASVFAVCIKAISFSGIPLLFSLYNKSL